MIRLCFRAPPLALLGLALAASLAVAAERVVVRGGEHEGFARVVFDWPAPVDYQVRLDGQQLMVSFDTAANFDLSVFERDLEDYVAGPRSESDGRVVVFPLKHRFDVKHYTSGPKLVIDLRPAPLAAPAAVPPAEMEPAAGGAPPHQAEATPAPAEAAPETKTAAAPDSATQTAPARTPVPVRLRVGEHQGFDRLVFDWPWVVDYRVEEGEDGAVIHFSRPGQVDLTRYQRDPPPRVLAIEQRDEQTALSVTLTLPGDATLRHYRDQGQVVFDVVGPKPPPATPADAAPIAEPAPQAMAETAPAEPAPLAQSEVMPEPAPPALAETAPAEPPLRADPAPHAEAAPTAESRTAAAEDLDSSTPVLANDETAAMPAEQPKHGDAGARQTGKALTMALPEAPQNDEPAPPAAPASMAPLQLLPESMTTPDPGVAEAAAQSAPAEATPAPAPSATAAKQDAAPPAVPQPASRVMPETPTVPPTPAPRRAETAPAGPAVPVEVTLVDAEPAEMPLASGPIPGREPPADQPVALHFAWAEPPAAAAFRYGDHIWLLFDRPSSDDLARKVAKLLPEFGAVDSVPSAGATILRLAAAPHIGARLSRDDTGWRFDLRARAQAPDIDLDLVPQPSRDDPRLLVPIEEPGAVHLIEDAESGGRFYVVPVGVPGLGLDVDQRFPQFQALASAQGLVVRPLSDLVEVTLSDEGAVVGSSEGLYLSVAEGRSLYPDAEEVRPGRRLFDLKAWRRGGPRQFAGVKQTLQQTIVDAEPRAANLARLDLARLYFANGMATEAIGLLELITKKDTALARDPQVLLMKGASEFLADKFEEAARTLAHPALADEWEATPWQAAMAAAAQDWGYAADRFFEGEALFGDYPRHVRFRLVLLAAEARLNIGDSGGADLYLTRLRDEKPDLNEQMQIKFLEGRRLALDEEAEAAVAAWREVAAGPHAPSSARARLALIETGLADGSLTPSDAVAELGRLRFAWRGDRFEYALLERLGNLEIELGEYRKGLTALRQAASRLPDAQRAMAITERMRKVFTEVFLGERGTELPPLSALALYEAFKELTPGGEVGDQLIAGLADKLVDVDLLDQAAALLEQQVEQRLEGTEKARIATRAALLRLMDRQPDRAMAILDASEVADLPSGLTDERRLLRARALAAADRRADALALLETDESAAALRLRAEIHWETKDWPQAAATLTRLLPRLPADGVTLDDEQARTAVLLAVAYSLAHDRQNLRDLAWRYGAAMVGTERAATFAMLTGNLDNSMMVSIADELAGVGTIQAFMEGYRERLQADKLSGIN